MLPVLGQEQGKGADVSSQVQVLVVGYRAVCFPL